MNAEQSLLGSFIQANYLIKDTLIQPTYFEDSRHKYLLQVMQGLIQKGNSVDVVTLSTLSDLQAIGGISYVNELKSYANVEKFDEYETLVLEDWREREKRRLLQKAISEDWDIDHVRQTLDALNQSKVSDHTSINHSLQDIFDRPFKDTIQQSGIPTGISQLTLMTGGFQDGELIIIGARPSMGKTDIMLHFAKAAGWAGYTPNVFSLEMPEKKITERLVASTGKFNRIKMRNPYRDFSDYQKRIWSSIIGQVEQTHIQIFDNSSQSIADIRAKMRWSTNEYPNKKPLILIDYLTLIRSKHFYNGNVHQQVTEISRDLKSMAKDFNCPVICLAQLNRNVEQRQNKRPQMSDIRESGSVEQDADVIGFLHREKYYDQTNTDDGLEIIIAKNRNGPIGTARADYNPYTGVVTDENKGDV